VGRHNFSHAAPQIWNAIPLNIRISLSVGSFRRNLKTRIILPLLFNPVMCHQWLLALLILPVDKTLCVLQIVLYCWTCWPTDLLDLLTDCAVHPTQTWLPVQFRINYKLCLLMHQIHISRAPSYLSDIVTQTATVSSRLRLRSGSYTTPAVWNSLPPTLQQISHTDSFKRQLKTFLFHQAYLDY